MSNATDFSLDRGLPSALDVEKSVLGSLIVEPNLLKDAAVSLSTSDFFLDAHRRLFATMVAFVEDGTPVDSITLSMHLRQSKELEAVGGVAYISTLTDGVPRRESISHYVKILREKATLRNVIHAAHGIAAMAIDGSDSAEVVLQRMADAHRSMSLAAEKKNWRSLFHSYEDFTNAAPLRFAINGFLQEDGVTMIAGPSGDGKTLMMLSMARALLSGEPLFGHVPFSVPVTAERVIYLIPEVGLEPFKHRLQLFHLGEYVRTDRFLYRTLSSKQPLQLTDHAFLEAVKGAHVFLDTAIRFMDGDESAAGEAKVFAQTLFDVQAAGAKTIIGAHHSPKSFDNADYMTLENVLRGSGDIGAMLSTCWGIKQVDADSTRIFVQNVKPRDFQPCEPFIIEGRPYIDERGTFVMVAQPGEAGELSDHQHRCKSGRKPKPDSAQKQELARSMRTAGDSYGAIAKELNVSKSLAFKWANSETAAFSNSVHGER